MLKVAEGVGCLVGAKWGERAGACLLAQVEHLEISTKKNRGMPAWCLCGLQPKWQTSFLQWNL